MPRYFFDIDNGAGFVPDEEGTEFASLEAMREQASRLLPEIARDEIRCEDARTLFLTVRDEAGNPVFEASLTFRAESRLPPNPVPRRESRSPAEGGQDWTRRPS